MSDRYTRILGIDYGSVRIGLSVSDPMKIIAQGLTTIPNDERTIPKLVKIIEEQNVERIVVGKPLNLKGELGMKGEEVAQFIRHLSAAISVEIVQIDERFTSVMAQRSMVTMGTTKKQRKNNKGKVDEIAAAILLQSYLDSVRH